MILNTKTIFWLTISLFLLNVNLLSQRGENSFEKAWKMVDSLESKGLVKQALEKTKEIKQKAKGGQDQLALIKAVAYTFKYQTKIVEKSDSLNIREMEAEIAGAVQPTKAILQSMLADMYHQYYRQNRYLILNRTELDQQTEDFQTWDANTILNKIADLYFLSLEPEKILQNESILDYTPILIKVKESEVYRPSLYDLLAHRALTFFDNTESGLTAPVEKFEPKADEVFVSSQDFIALIFNTPDQNSRILKTLKIFQKLLILHSPKGAKAPFVDVEMARLQYLKNHAKGENNDTLYLRSLENLAQTVGDEPIAGEIHFAIAKLYQKRSDKYQPLKSDLYQWDRKKSMRICEEVIKKYPKSYGASQCQALKAEIELPKLSLQSESANLANQSFRLQVSYSNIERIHYRIIKTPENLIGRRLRQKEFLKKLLEEVVVKEGAFQLSNQGDYQTHTTEIPIPELASGTYTIIAASTEKFDLDKDIWSYINTQVSGLAYYQRTIAGKMEIYVTQRESGKPVSGAKVQLYKRDNSSGGYNIYGEPITTTKEGLAIMETNEQNYSAFQLKISHKEDFYASDRLYLYPFYDRVGLPVTKVHFFSDRKIYRPGQTVYFKAILLKRSGDQHEIRPNSPVEITLFDVNSQEVQKFSLTSNEYGTVSGSFAAPSSGLLGKMYLQTKGGYHDFSVEEYKRPKFEVSFNPVKGEFTLNDEVEVEGQATAFSGANITGAKVNYRVVREVQYPYWFGYFWRFPVPQSESQEIANGTTLTNETGTFTIPFSLVPDASVAKTQKPVFSYRVYADVVDITGETHNANTTIKAGYIGLDVKLEAKNDIDIHSPTAFSIQSNNLNGNFEPAKGTLTIERLQEPNQVFRKRRWNQADQRLIPESEYRAKFPYDVYKAENEYLNWAVDDSDVFSEDFNTAESKKITVTGLKEAQPGKYRITLLTEDKAGEEIKIIKYVNLIDPNAKKLSLPNVLTLSLDKATAEPGETINVILATTEKKTWVRVDVEKKGKIILTQLVKVKGKKKVRIPILIKEAYRGNITVSAVAVKHNQFYELAETVTVPWTNKELKLSWSTFRDKLLPGEQETWKLKISGNKSEEVAAEMVATLYDASLDQFRSNSFGLSLYQSDYRKLNWEGYDGFGLNNSRGYYERSTRPSYPTGRSYDNLNWFGGLGFFMMFADRSEWGSTAFMAAPRDAGAGALDLKERNNAAYNNLSIDDDFAEEPEEFGLTISAGLQDSAEIDNNTPETNSGSVPIRTNLNETAFFFPHLKTNEAGEITLDFTIPEALTRWKFLGLAHTKDLQIGTIEGATVTQKDLMIIPNQPRFFREGDKMTFSAKVSNLSEETLSGKATLSLLDAFTRKPLDERFGLSSSSQNFTVEMGQNAAVDWEISIPADVPAVVLQVTAEANDFSDGEEHIIPILRNSILVTESIPLAIRGEENKQFTFSKLLASDESETLKHQKLTLEFTSNPAWYAVQSLPYLMEFPHECTEQIFSRFYANSLASHIANESPNVKNVFEQWRNNAAGESGAFLSNLEKNQDLKSVLLSETPWVLNARSESERKKRIGLLFDVNRMSEELSNTREQLLKRQLKSGAFSWFPGMSPSRYITQLIVRGMGQLQSLNVSTAGGNPEINKTMVDAIKYLDREILEDYQRLDRLKIAKEEDHLGYTQIQYLYARSFFTDIPLSTGTEVAYNYYYNQSKKFWLKKSRYMQGMLALTLHRGNDFEDARNIMAALKESAIFNPELGMYWKRKQNGWYWYQAPIEEHALMIEAFNEVGKDEAAVEELKIWLLKNKQTNDWETTRATAAACQALLSTGSDWLEQNEIVAVTLGDVAVNPFQREDTKVEAGTGYFKTSWDKSEIKPEMGNVRVSKKDKGIAWGSLYWQYFEEMDKITYANTPLSLRKEVFKVENTSEGPKLVSTDKSKLKAGDKIRVRIELRVDRAMEYVHMKDLRASAFEPVNVISSYKYQAGLGYYQSTKDAATHFFFDYLPKGTHVFEYDLYATQKGDFANGITTIQCMYAPEFTSHSEGIRVKVE